MRFLDITSFIIFKQSTIHCMNIVVNHKVVLGDRRVKWVNTHCNVIVHKIVCLCVVVCTSHVCASVCTSVCVCVCVCVC